MQIILNFFFKKGPNWDIFSILWAAFIKLVRVEISFLDFLKVYDASLYLQQKNPWTMHCPFLLF